MVDVSNETQAAEQQLENANSETVAGARVVESLLAKPAGHEAASDDEHEGFRLVQMKDAFAILLERLAS